jgi:PAS domain S-box-containing protein
MRVLPRVLGRPDAKVESTITPHRATYVIDPPRRGSPIAWLRRLVNLPGAARAAVEEVARQQHQLNRALEEVRSEHAELRSHVEQIATLDRLGRALAKQLGSEQLPDRILDFLTQRFGWSGASLSMKAPDDETLLFYGRSGRTQGEAASSHPLVFGGRPLGHLEVWSEAEAQSVTDRELFERLLPWIAMTVMNARFAANDEASRTGLRWASKSGRDLFMILDQNARILYAGPRVDEILGYESDDLLQMDVTDLIHPDDWPQLAEDFSALAPHSSSAIYSSARVQNRDGNFRRMEGVAIKVLSEAGAGVYLISCGDAGERSASH